MTEVQELVARLRLKDDMTGPLRKVRSGISGVSDALNSPRMRKGIAQIGTGIKTAVTIAAVGLAALATQVAAGLASLVALEKVTTQTNAVLKSTKGVAGQTAESIRNLAEKYEGLNATIDDKVIQSAANVLLTFTAIRKDAFEPAIKAALDMSTALGTDLQGSVIQIGKALQDPIKGITALRRVGVNFSADQIKVIKRLVETGQTLKAQKLILAELNTEFGGSFLAGGNTTAGKVAKFHDAIEDLQMVLADGLLPTITKVADKLSGFLADPQVVREVGKLGEAIASIFSDKNLAAGGKFLGDVFDTAKAAAPVVKEAAVATLGAVQAAVGLFRSLPPEIQKLAIGAFAINKITGGLVTNIAGGLISAVISSFKGLMNVNAAVVTVNGPVGGIPGAAGGAGRLGQAASLITKVFVVGMAAEVASLIAGSVQELGGSIHTAIFGNNGDPLSDFGKAWDDWRKNADWPFGQKNAPEWAGGFGSTSGGSVTAGGFDSRLSGGFLTQIGSSLNGFLTTATTSMTQPLRAFNKAFQDAVAGLKTATKPADIQKAVASALAVVTKRGGATATGKVLVDLKNQLVHTTDPQTRRILKEAIAKVHQKLVGRQLVQKQLDKADAILKSHKSTDQKIRDLKVIEKSLEHTSRSGQAKVAAKIEAVKKAEEATKLAIAKKKLAVTIPITANVTTGGFDIRTVIGGATTIRRYGNATTSISTKFTNINPPS